MEEEGETGGTPTRKHHGGLAEEEEEEAEEALGDQVEESTMRLKRRCISIQT